MPDILHRCSTSLALLRIEYWAIVCALDAGSMSRCICTCLKPAPAMEVSNAGGLTGNCRLERRLLLGIEAPDGAVLVDRAWPQDAGREGVFIHKVWEVLQSITA